MTESIRTELSQLDFHRTVRPLPQEGMPQERASREPAVEVATTEAITVRISTNQYGVKTVWLTGEDGKPMGCTPCGHEHETAFWILERFLGSYRPT